MDLISWILLVVAVGLVAALMWSVKRSGVVLERAREVEANAASQKNELAEVRTAATMARRELEEVRKDYKSAQDEMKESKRKAFQAQKSQQDRSSMDDEAAMIRLRRERDDAVAKSQVETERLTAANEQLRKQVEQLKVQVADVSRKAGQQQDAIKGTGGQSDGDGDREWKREMERELSQLRTRERKAAEKGGDLDNKLARVSEQLERIRKEGNEMKGQLREKDNELLSLRKRTVTAERSYILLEREHELVAARLAHLEGKSFVDFNVTPVGDPLGADVARSADNRGGAAGGRGNRRDKHDRSGARKEPVVAIGSSGDDSASSASTPVEAESQTAEPVQTV